MVSQNGRKSQQFNQLKPTVPGSLLKLWAKEGDTCWALRSVGETLALLTRSLSLPSAGQQVGTLGHLAGGPTSLKATAPRGMVGRIYWELDCGVCQSHSSHIHTHISNQRCSQLSLFLAFRDCTSVLKLGSAVSSLKKKTLTYLPPF